MIINRLHVPTLTHLISDTLRTQADEQRSDICAELFNEFGHAMFLTGSRVIGGATSESDWDIVIPIGMRKLVEDFLVIRDIVVTDSDYNKGFKIHDGTMQINFIPLHDLDYNAWYWATQRLANRTFVDKNHRHRQFEFAVLAFKDLIAESTDYYTRRGCAITVFNSIFIKGTSNNA